MARKPDDMSAFISEIVETHAFKGAFIRGEVTGFVVAGQLPPTPGHPARPVFAEIYGAKNCYYIFETQTAAEFALAVAATSDPPADGLQVREVRVENIRDYRTVAGFKTVLLVNRKRQAAESLRVGDAPIHARSRTPFPFPNREGLRLVQDRPFIKPIAAPPLAAPEVSEAKPERPARQPIRLELSDLVAGEDRQNKEPIPLSSLDSTPGPLRRLLRKFRAWI